VNLSKNHKILNVWRKQTAINNNDKNNDKNDKGRIRDNLITQFGPN
jgi:hypothetical protein